jgi:hypothetical protein
MIPELQTSANDLNDRSRKDANSYFEPLSLQIYVSNVILIILYSYSIRTVRVSQKLVMLPKQRFDVRCTWELVTHHGYDLVRIWISEQTKILLSTRRAS